MAQPSSNKIYYKKAFENSRRCLKEAVEQSHPSAKKSMKLSNIMTQSQELVMRTDEAILWCMANHLPDWSQGTWRMHRCGYRLLLVKLVESGKVTKERAKELNEMMSSSSGKSRKERVKKTSSRRKKKASPEDIQKISEVVKDNSSKWGEALIIWLQAAIATGLRPNEWRTATLIEDDNRLILRSKNFKRNEVRSYADFREIDLTDSSEESIGFVKKQVSIVQGMIKNDMMESYYNGCASLLYWCNKKIWKKRKANITLYTGRHQFSANAKADETVSDVERAALMGHKTTKTSTERYGLGRHGSKGLTPKIADRDVLKNIVDPIRNSPKNKFNS